MSSEEQEILTGSDSLEHDLGFEKMPLASPIPKDDLDSPTLDPDDSAIRHLSRAAPSVEPLERDYYGPDGERTPSNQTVNDPRQVAHDLALSREQERKALQDQDAQDLRDALDTLHGDQNQQPAQDRQPQPDLEVQPEQVDPDAAYAQAQATISEADQKIAEFLQDPYVRERVEQSFNHVRQEAGAEVERANAVATAFQNHYAAQTNNLVAESNALLVAQFPELSGAQNPEQLRGALAALQASNPARAQAFIQLASRAQGLVEAQQRQQHEAQQALALQRDYELERFTAAETARFEKATQNDSAIAKVKEHLYPTVEKFYGVNKQQLDDLYTGRQRVDSAAFVRSAAFQLMLTDAVKYRLAAQGITQARSNPIPKVQRPGVSSGEPRGDDSEASSAMARFNSGPSEGPQAIKNAAAWLSAKRARG